MNEQQRRRFASAIARLAGDESTLIMLADMVAEDAPTLLKLLDEHATADNAPAYAKTAHAMRGLLSTFETEEPVSELQPIIDAARAGELESVRQMHCKIAPDLRFLLTEIGEITK